jgi:hypothetical protein
VIIAFAIAIAYHFKIFDISGSVEVLNNQLLLGVPLPIWVYALLGSLTSMLYRADKIPFKDINEGISWIMHRSIVGIVMGVMTYLMLVAGLIIFAGKETAIQVPQLVWVLAFLGGFSDTLSMDLLDKISGKIGLTGDQGTGSNRDNSNKVSNIATSANVQTDTRTSKEASPQSNAVENLKTQPKNDISPFLSKAVIEPFATAVVENIANRATDKILEQTKKEPIQDKVAQSSDDIVA